MEKDKEKQLMYYVTLYIINFLTTIFKHGFNSFLFTCQKIDIIFNITELYLKPGMSDILVKK